MNIAEEYQVLVEKRKQIEMPDYDNDAVIKCEIALLSSDIMATIGFLEHECSGEQAVFISEILDEVVEKTQSEEIIEAFFKCIARYPDVAEEYNLSEFGMSAREFLK